MLHTSSASSRNPLRAALAINFLFLLLALIFWAGCGSGSDPTFPEPTAVPDLTMIALGDSYTVGQALPQQWSWPSQLADSLAAGGDTLRTLDVVAQTGWTTRDLLDALRDSLAEDCLDHTSYCLVTLMIGVNNQFQGVDLDVFQTELDTLLDLSLALAGGETGHVLGFSIPDYGVTPVGGLFDPAQICVEIQAHNQILSQKFSERGITLLDITTLSLQAAHDPTLVARDGLHFSREMYRLWVAMMLPSVAHCLDLETGH